MIKPMILGMPWLVKENPHINWTRSTVVVQQGQHWILLPLAKLGEDTSAHLVNMISAKQMSQLLKRKQVDNAFLGFVRMVKEANVAEKYKGKSNLGVVHLWREDLPKEIKLVHKKYDDVFPKYCHPGFHLFARGTSSRLSWKMMCPQCTGHYTN